MRYLFLHFHFFQLKKNFNINLFFHIKTIFSANVVYFVKNKYFLKKKKMFFQLSLATNEQPYLWS